MSMNEMNIELGVVPEKDHKIVTDPAIARKLCKDGFVITDIKPKKSNSRESVYIFKVIPGFMEKMNEYISEKKSRRSENEQS